MYQREKDEKNATVKRKGGQVEMTAAAAESEGLSKWAAASEQRRRSGSFDKT
jgi:hypothetical protein